MEENHNHNRNSIIDCLHFSGFDYRDTLHRKRSRLTYELEFHPHSSDENRTEKVYSFLIKEGYSVPEDLVDFKISLKDRNNSDALHNFLEKENYYLPNKETFYGILSNHYKSRIFAAIKKSNDFSESEEAFYEHIRDSSFQNQLYTLLKNQREDNWITEAEFRNRLKNDWNWTPPSDDVEVSQDKKPWEKYKKTKDPLGLRDKLTTTKNLAWNPNSLSAKGFDSTIIWKWILISIGITIVSIVGWMTVKLLIRLYKRVTTERQLKLRFYIGLGVVAVILAITNPTLKDFKESGHDHGQGNTYLYRKSNYILFSVFVCQPDEGHYEKTYLGVFKNFYETN